MKELGWKGVFVIGIIVVIFTILYANFIGNTAVAFLAIVLAIGGTYYVICSVNQEERPPKLNPGEENILKAHGAGYILTFREKGFMGRTLTNRRANYNQDIYLTSERIVIQESGGYVRGEGRSSFDIPLDDIKDVQVKRGLLNRLEITYKGEGGDRKITLFAGDPKLWKSRLDELIH